jgi:fatty-acyl-CoA synthase/fatty acid CoA ligase FadD22
VNLAATIEERAATGGWQDRPALVVEGRTLLHREVHEGAARTASLLASLGVRRGDAVLLALADGAEFAWAFLGAVRRGALAVPVNPQLLADEHRGLASGCRAAAVVCSDELSSRFPNVPVVGSSSLEGAVAAHAPEPAVAVGADEAAYAQYTSGTTGAPRAAVHRHGDPLVYSAASAEPILRLGTTDVVLSVSKMYFAYGLGNSLFFPLLTGACAVVHPGRPRPEDVVALVERHRVTVLFAVPTFYANLLRAAAAAAAAEGEGPSPFRSLRVAVSAGERLTAGLAERTSGLLGCPLLDSLGTTEVGQAFVGGSPDALRAGTVGRALPPYEVAVRDKDGRDLPPGSVGMLWVRGPSTLLEYLGQPEATAAAFDGDWLRTGDLASLDEDGFLSHHGRADDMEMVGGITVAPQEIEELLSTHPAVSEVAVAGVADDTGASRLQAYVVPHPDVAADEGLVQDLTGLARSRLAPYKVPRSFTFVDALPRTPTGKLRRFVLRSGGGCDGWPARRSEDAMASANEPA